jgi:hypothetical protein
MDESQPKRPWWRRKRVSAVLAAWLLAAYVLSLGPAHYAAVRGWLPRPLLHGLGAFHSPLTDGAYSMERAYGVPTHQLLLGYVIWWRSLAGEP